MQTIVTRHEWDSAPPSIKAIRQSVFIEEQNVPESLEWDESDAIAQHFLATTNKQAAAVARLIVCDKVGKIGRIAVTKPFRKQGIASKLILEVMREGLSQGCTEFYLSAQTQAQSLYNKLGFYATGDTYLDAGIEHIDMLNKTPELITRLDTATFKPQGANFILGHDSNTHLFSSPNECKQLITAMACQATRKIKILSRHLESEIYDSEAIRDAFSTLARTNPRSEIQLLVVNERPLVTQRQRIIELIRRLPSSIYLKLINTSYPYDESSMALFDREGVVFQKENSIYEGFANFNNPGRVKQLTEIFDNHWAHGKESLELRQLKL